MQRSDQTEQSTDELLAEVEQLTDDASSEEHDRRPDPAEGDTRRSRLRGLFSGRWLTSRAFSPRSFLTVLLLLTLSMFLGSAVPLVGVVGQFVGLFVAAFAVGAVGSRRRYLEVGLSGALAAGLGFVLSTLTSALFPFAVRLLADYGVAIAGVGAATGAIAALAGHYFGRDLRDGLTRDI